MEGIVKISKITAQAICTMTPDQFLFGEKLAEEGFEAETFAQNALERIKRNKLVETKDWLFVYVADQRGDMFAKVRPVSKPIPYGEKTR